MSLLLSEDEFGDARDAVRAGTVTTELYAWLGRLVAVAQATRALAPAPIPGGRWDDPDAVAETVHAWLEDSLLRGGLLQAFDVCQTPRALSRYLERALRNWLVSQSRRRGGPRLLERAGEIMRSDAAFSLLRDASTVSARWWGRASWQEPQLFTGPDREVVAAAWALGDFALLRFPSSERSDPVLSSPDLRRYLAELLTRVGQGLSGQHFDLTFRSRFVYAYEPAAAEPEEAAQLADPRTSAEHAEVADAARVALAALSGRQLHVLRERPQGTLEELGRALGVSRGTVDNEYRRALLKVREAAPSNEAFGAVLEKVLDLASDEVT